MARGICFNPCLIGSSATMAMPSVPLPYISTPVKPIANLNFKAGCDGCELTVNLLLQIQPYMLSLQIPLCLLLCAQAVFSAGTNPDPAHPSNMGVVDEITDVLTNLALPLPPNMTAVVQATAYATTKCAECFLFAPCKFCCLLEAVCTAIISVLNCLKSLMQHLLTLKLKATGLSTNASVEVRNAAQCLFGLVAVQQQNLGIKFNVIGALLKVVEYLYNFACAGGPCPPIPPMQLTIGPNTSIPVIVAQIDQLIADITPVKNYMAGCCCP